MRLKTYLVSGRALSLRLQGLKRSSELLGLGVYFCGEGLEGRATVFTVSPALCGAAVFGKLITNEVCSTARVIARENDL